MKRLFCAIMTIAMVLSTTMAFTGTAFAGTVNSKQLETAITAVKKAITIPENLSEFEYYNDEKSEAESLIALTWSDKEQESNISVSVDTAGNITSYYANLPEFEPKGLSKVTKEQAEKLAGEYIKKFLPSAIGTFKHEKDADYNNGDEYLFNYRMYINDIPCDFINVRVGINKYAEKISSYRYNGEVADLALKEYPAKDKIITEDEAQKAYISKLGPNLKYKAYYDYTKKTLKVFTAYENDKMDKAIDAGTGDIVNAYNGASLYRSNAKAESTMNAGGASGGRSQFTEEELSEIQKTQSLLTKEQADKIARDLTGISSSQKLSSTTLSNQGDPNQDYIWQLRYEPEYAMATINAEDGSLISFDNFKPTKENDKRDIGKEKAKTIAESYLDKVCADKKDMLVWTNEENAGDYGNTYPFIYTRKVGDICFDNNNVVINVDKATGDISSYRKTWYDKAEFPDLKGIITKEAAFDKMAAMGEFGLMYQKSGEKDSEGKVQLVYTFRSGENYCLDAYKGIRLDYRGNAYIEAGNYTDISGHWAEKTINELKNNGYYLAGDKFMPKAATTQLEFFKYLYSPQQGWHEDTDDFYNMLVRNKIITKEEINPTAYMTRQEAAKFSARYMGVDKLAKNSSVFKNMYTDKVAQEYLGYASAAHALGIMKADSNGRFNGASTMNHAETACLVYNILNNN